MKNLLFCIICVLFSFIKSEAQDLDRTLFSGLTVGTESEIFFILGGSLESNFKKIVVRYELNYLTNFGDNRLQVKLGCGYKNNDWKVFIYLPYMNFNVEQIGYNTPLCSEIFYKDFLSLNLDVYKNTVVPSIKIKMLLHL